MTALRERTARAAGAGRPLPLSAALLLARSFALVALAAVALLVALAAWFAVRAALAVDPVVATERVWLQYGHHRPPYAHVKLDPLKYNVPGPAYDVSLEATLPVNENNIRLGNFMVSLSLVDSLGSRAVNVSRPAILDPSNVSNPQRDRTSSVSLIRTLATLPLALLSPTPLTRCLASPVGTHLSTVLQVPLLENVALTSTPAPSGGAATAGGRRQSRWKGFTSRGGERRGRGGPVDTMFVEIGRRDTYPLTRDRETDAAAPLDLEEGEFDAIRRYSRGHPGLGRELQVYEAWIKVQVKPKGLRALVHRHPWITFLFFFPTFLTFEATAAVAIYFYFVATAPSSFSSAKDTLEVRAGEEEDLRTTPLPFGGSGSGASSPGAATTTTMTNESEEPPTSATPSDYEHLSDDSELVHGDEEEEVAAAAAARRVEERRRRRRQESMRLGRGGVGMSAASLGGGGGGGAGVEAEVEAGETESYMEGDSASDGDGRGGEETGVGFGLEEMEEAEWVKGEEDQEEGASTVAASATTRRTTSTFGPSVAGTSASSSSSAAATGVSWPISRARQREQAPRFSGRVDEADEADL